tara:strand:- start:621 stop:833 length:213 start_codon:yes stop_codon:yes gene_type:complete
MAEKKYEETYNIKIFDNERDKEISFLPIHIKATHEELHKNLIDFIKFKNKDKSYYVSDGHGKFIRKDNEK